MQLISCHDGKLYINARDCPARGKMFTTGLAALDAIAPAGAFAYGAIHEILYPPQCEAAFFPLLLAGAASRIGLTRANGGAIVWSDPRRQLYLPALVAAGIQPHKLFLLHPQNTQEEIWAVAECLRCKGVSVTVANVRRLSRLEARRLQLAAEQGAGAGILLRPLGPAADIYAAATRWLIHPASGERGVQRWMIQLVHGHGGQINQTLILEHFRETNHVRVFKKLADRPAQTRPAIFSMPA